MTRVHFWTKSLLLYGTTLLKRYAACTLDPKRSRTIKEKMLLVLHNLWWLTVCSHMVPPYAMREETAGATIFGRNYTRLILETKKSTEAG